MDGGDIEKLDKLLQFELRMLAARIEMEGMIAENIQREIEGQSMAYTEEAFFSIEERNSIRPEDYPKFDVKET